MHLPVDGRHREASEQERSADGLRRAVLRRIGGVLTQTRTDFRGIVELGWRVDLPLPGWGRARVQLKVIRGQTWCRRGQGMVPSTPKAKSKSRRSTRSRPARGTRASSSWTKPGRSTRRSRSRSSLRAAQGPQTEIPEVLVRGGDHSEGISRCTLRESERSRFGKRTCKQGFDS